MKTAIAALALLAGTTASADVITSYVNFGQPGTQASSPVGTVAANVTALPLTRGAGLVGNAGTNSLNAAGWDSLGATDYITFGFNVAPGFAVDLDTLWFGSRSSNSGPGQLGVFWSGDGFTTPVFTFSQSGTNFTNSIANLSALQGLTGANEFRIFATSPLSATGGAIGSSGTFRVGDHFDGTNFTEFRFEGTVVPAPASAALLGLGGLAAARRRR
jgi:hypothetical protein